MKPAHKISGRNRDILLFSLGFLPLLSWFLYQTHFYATHVRLGVPPDELHHYTLALFYRDAPGIFLTASERTYPYGPIDYHPYLYHLIAGKLLLLNFIKIPEHLFLRHLSIICSVGTLFAFWSLLRELKIPWLGKLTAVAAMTNITMFVYVSSAVSYDNFINLLAISMQLFLIQSIRAPAWSNWLLFATCLLAGSLAKVTFLPCYLALVPIFILFYRPIVSSLKAICSQKMCAKEIALSLLAVSLLVGNIHLYGGNYLKFGSIIPAFEQVVGQEVAVTHYAQARRDKLLIESKESRADMDFTSFLPKYFRSALWSIYGIMGHKSFYYEETEMRRFYLTGVPAAVGTFVFLVLFLLRKEPSSLDVRRAAALVFLFALLYISIVVLDNFKSFKTVRVFGYSLQGRYLFPVLGNLLAIFAYLSFNFLKTWWVSFALAATISCVFFRQGFWSVVGRLQGAGFF